ncbi:hypothetical protein BCR44DRAFT_1497495 [Catenaria anguillulae PL171]|uniref:PCI domain-containing protein n=1 Tax=Catenaria anguillulae PL171 TaxID=765915 RepID=A0A1Y2HXG2_9FUNG|nr:hypothetical protein BCR44DRAFT_1497495 [Catenaria anguillulae PL171]
MGPPAKLVPFLLLAKSSRGAAAADLVLKAIEAPGVYVFGELLAQPSIAALQQSHPPAFALLQLFAYGTLAEYSKLPEPRPTLTSTMIHKLRLLTLISLAHTSRVLSYDLLLRQLQLDSSAVRDLEDLFIEAMYDNLIKATIDQRRRELHVESAVGRDVAPADLDQIAATLKQWCDVTTAVLETIDDSMKNAVALAGEAHAAEQKLATDLKTVLDKKDSKSKDKAIHGNDFGMLAAFMGAGGQ